MQKLLRAVFYFSGLIILSLGIILNTKSAFGVTPIISIAYCLSLLHNWNFGNASFVMYCVLAVIEYLVKGKRFRAIDLLQIPLSVVLTRFFNLFGAVLPDVTSLPARILCLILGIALTGIGAAMIGVGRFIWIYNRLFQQKQLQLTGVEA